MSAGALPAAATAKIAGLVQRRAGLVFPPNRRDDMDRGIRSIMAKAGITDAMRCVTLLRGDTALLDELIAALTIGETYFFRSPGHYSGIRDTIIPEIRRLRGAEHVLRLWSAGCASGEEAYSLAILIDQMGLGGQARVLATDISPAALARAKKGEYGSWSLRGDAAQRLVGTHILSVGGRFQVTAHIRRQVIFAYLNLAQDCYPTFATGTWGMDIVLCCNVLIYFDVDTVRAVARRLHDSLAEGGFLIVGPSDPPLAEHAPFQTILTPTGVIYRKLPARDDRQTPVAAANEVFAPSTFVDDTVLAEPIAERPTLPMSSPHLAGDAMDDARAALARGENARVAELTLALPASAAVVALRLRALGNLGDVETASSAASAAVASHPGSTEIGFLHAIFLMNLGNYRQAERALRRVIYLDPSLIVGHFALAATLNQLGKRGEASRAYRNAHDLAARRPADDVVLFSDGENAGQMVKASKAQMALLATATEGAA